MADTEEKNKSQPGPQDEVTAESNKTVGPESGVPDVPGQTSPRLGASDDSTDVSLPGGGPTTGKDASQSQVIPDAVSADGKDSTTSEETDPVKQTASAESDISLPNEETTGALLSVGVSPSEAVSTQAAGESGSPVTVQPAEETDSTVTAPAAEKEDSTAAGKNAEDSDSTVTGQPGEKTDSPTTVQSSGEADTPAQPMEDSPVTVQPAEKDPTVSAPLGEGDDNAASEADVVKMEVDQKEESGEKSDSGKSTPIITTISIPEEYCSLDMGVDMVENMDTGTDDQTDQKAEKMEDVDVKMIMPEDNTDSNSSTVNSVSVRDTQSPGIIAVEMGSGLSPPRPLEDSKQQLDLVSNSGSSSGEATPRTVSSEAGVKDEKDEKDDKDGLKNGRKKKKQGVEKVEVKDEPIDEEYDKAMGPSNSASIKDEPEMTEDNLKIGAVYGSVAGAFATTVPGTQVPPLVPAAMSVACTSCKKILSKGQTAYQKKGSPHLFCSTKCLTSYPSPSTKNNCHYCLKEVQSPKDLIKSPVDAAGTIKDFCSSACLTSFNYKRNSAVSTLSTTTSSQSSKSVLYICAVCKKASLTYSHEVVKDGSMHRLCSDNCFKSFCSSNQLTLNSACTTCGNICQGKTPQTMVAGVMKTYCNSKCQTIHKQKNKANVPCTMCRATRPMMEMVEVTTDGVTELYCNVACVTAHKVQTVSSSGIPVHCENCKEKKVPAYHLAMSDSSIRNFCCLNCVLTFQEQFNKANGPKPVNVGGTPPPSQLQTQLPNSTKMALQANKLMCYLCQRVFASKPEVLQLSGQLVFFCATDCVGKFRRLNPTVERCEYCKMDKVINEVHRINEKNCSFCSEGCKLLYKHELNKKWSRHCRQCAYCTAMSSKLVTGQFGGKNENFCSEPCRSKYTMLFCQVAKCDHCGRQARLKEKLNLLEDVKHFCDTSCLVRFCCGRALSQGGIQTKVPVAPGGSSANPVIANVVSLAGTPTGQPNTYTALQGTVPSQMKIMGNVSTQTPNIPTAPPKVLKNKSLLCKPIVQNKGITCKTQMIDSSCQTDGPSMMIVPVPVPVYVPVPMGMYSQCTPKPVGLPIPVPVPMFLPVTLDNAERIVETILDIKERIPSNPFEADILMMAAMVADDDDDEKKEEKEGEKEKNKEKEKKTSPAHVPEQEADRMSNYSEDLNTDDINLSSFLEDWQEDPAAAFASPRGGFASPHAGFASPPHAGFASAQSAFASPGAGFASPRRGQRSGSSRPYASEKLQPIIDIPVGKPPPTPVAPPPPPPPPPRPRSPVLDIEAEYPIETLEQMAHWRTQAAMHAPPKKKGGRKSRGPTTMETAMAVASLSGDWAAPEPLSLESKYGVDAWKRWVRWRSTQTDLEPLPRFGMRPMILKEDILQCTTAELGYGLCRFIVEAQKPGGGRYSPDTLFYLCLGIQQYLFQKSRMENIFTDAFYSKFTQDISSLLKDFQPTVTRHGYIHSRVEENYLWDCKQLGAYSPMVLLNTLLFFCTKLFGFRTVEQHRQLSFGHVMRCTSSNAGGTKTNFLRFYPPMPAKDLAKEKEQQDAEQAAGNDGEGVSVKRKREEPEKENVLEMVENSENPLRCPVRLYEFYLSKCSESVKQRTNLFYLHPERSCVPNSPLWYSSAPLDDSFMESMLTRILSIREVHLAPPETAGRSEREEGAGAAKRKTVRKDDSYAPTPMFSPSKRGRGGGGGRGRGRKKKQREPETESESSMEEEDDDDFVEDYTTPAPYNPPPKREGKPRGRGSLHDPEPWAEDDEEEGASSSPPYEEEDDDDYWRP